MVVTGAEIRKELNDLNKKVEAAWKRHEATPGHENRPFVCPGVGVVGNCTYTSVYLASRLGGDVYGYQIKDNSKAIVGSGEFGHDFVLIGGKFLVDFWAKDTYEYRDLYDLSKLKDAQEVLKMYGSMKFWTKMSPEDFKRWEGNLSSYEYPLRRR